MTLTECLQNSLGTAGGPGDLHGYGTGQHVTQITLQDKGLNQGPTLLPKLGLSLSTYLFTEPQEADGIGLSPEAACAIHTAGPGNDKYGLGPGDGVVCVSIVGGEGSRYVHLGG